MMIRTGDIKGSYIDYSNVKYIDESFHTKNVKSQLKCGDILIARHGSSGHGVIFDSNKPANALNIVILRTDEKLLLSRYLVQLLDSPGIQKQVAEASAGSTQNVINTSQIAKLLISIPELSEQKEVVNVCEALDSLIETLERQIFKKKAIKQGTMQELLTGKKRLPGFSGTWIHTRIGAMTEVYSGGTPNTAEPSFWGGTIPWMNSGELNLKIVRHVEGRITKAGMDSSSTHYIPAECILIGLAGQGKTRGTAAFNTFSLCTNQSIAAIYPNPDLFDSKFMYYMMDTQYEKLRELSSGDGGRGGLNKKLILDYEVIIPQNVREQAAIAEVLTEMDNEIENLEEKLAKYRQLKQGMMQQLLTGKIRLM